MIFYLFWVCVSFVKIRFVIVRVKRIIYLRSSPCVKLKRILVRRIHNLNLLRLVTIMTTYNVTLI